jgi:hypothetical protein
MPNRSCHFDDEVTLLSWQGPPRYVAFMEGVRYKRRLYTIHERRVWATLENHDGKVVVPFWLSREGAKECVARSWPGLAVASVPISRVVDEWTMGWLPREVRLAVGIESAAEGVLVDQHRFWAQLAETVDHLPHYRPHRGRTSA